jgi:hypothetical protein
MGASAVKLSNALGRKVFLGKELRDRNANILGGNEGIGKSPRNGVPRLPVAACSGKRIPLRKFSMKKPALR